MCRASTEPIPSTEGNLGVRWRDWLDISHRARSPSRSTPAISSARWGSLQPSAFVSSTTGSMPRAGSARRRSAPSSGRSCAWTPATSPWAWLPASSPERDTTSPFGPSLLWPIGCRGHACSSPVTAHYAERSRRWRVPKPSLASGQHSGIRRRHQRLFHKRVIWCCSRRFHPSGRDSGSPRRRRWRQACPSWRPMPDRYPKSCADGEPGLCRRRGRWRRRSLGSGNPCARQRPLTSPPSGRRRQSKSMP